MWFWVLVVVLVLLLLGLFFGGYRKGTRISGSGSGPSGYSDTRVMNSHALATPPVKVASTGTTRT
jgi:hypothetical protein